jgi:DNA-binding beta-propeller fold protein YncE
MGLTRAAQIELPAHLGNGGFDHAAVDRARHLLYVAHTANDAIDVIDIASDRYVRSIAGLKGVAGALVDEASGFIFTSNRGENTVGIFRSDAADVVERIAVGIKPNGLAYDADRGILLCANVGDPGVPNSPSVTLIDVARRKVLATIPMPGRTRWAMFDPERRVFFVNIAEPFQIVVVDPERAGWIVQRFDVPARGPHGLGLESVRHRLYCACDQGQLVSLDSRSGEIIATLELSGAPDVVFLDPVLSRLYVAIGDPGVIDVVDVAGWKRIESVSTGPGAHTIALDESRHRIYAFLPRSHEAWVFMDEGGA